MGCAAAHEQARYGSLHVHVYYQGMKNIPVIAITDGSRRRTPWT
jgi:hypothetical protein